MKVVVQESVAQEGRIRVILNVTHRLSLSSRPFVTMDGAMESAETVCRELDLDHYMISSSGARIPVHPKEV